MNIRVSDLEFLKQLKKELVLEEDNSERVKTLGLLIDKLELSREIRNDKVRESIGTRRKFDKNYARTKAVKKNAED